jgi:hypothetical protein
MFNRKGSILLIAYTIIFVLIIFVGMYFTRSTDDKKFFDINLERVQASYLAEAAVDDAIYNLGTPTGYNSYIGTPFPVSLGRGQYESTVTTINSTTKKIVATGYVPTKTAPRATRIIEAFTRKSIPPNFYDYSIYSADNFDGGNSANFLITGKAVYAGATATPDIINDPNHVTGGSTHDPTVSPLAHFDFQVLLNVARSQTYYDSQLRKTVNNEFTSTDLAEGRNFPSTFEYSPGVPNVVYVEGALTLSGSTTVGGFFVVVGNILQTPTVTVDTTLSGAIKVNGCIYSTGDFSVNGGGNKLNVDGGVWAGTGVSFNGGGKVTYNAGYMTEIKNMVDNNSAGGAVQLLSWRELQ